MGIGVGIRYLYDTRAAAYAASALVGLHHIHKYETAFWGELMTGGRTRCLSKAASAIRGIAAAFTGFSDTSITFRGEETQTSEAELPDNIRGRANRFDIDLDSSISNRSADVHLAASVTRHFNVCTARPPRLPLVPQPSHDPPFHLWTQKKLQQSRDADRTRELFNREPPGPHTLPFALAAYTLSSSGPGTGNWL